MDTPTYEISITVGGKSQTTETKIGNVLPQSIITRQSGKLIATFVDAAGVAFDLTTLSDLDLFAKPFNSSEVPVNMGTGVISGAGNNIYTVTWVRDLIPAGWSSFAEDRDGTIVLYLQLEETGTADYYQWSTRFNVEDGDYVGDASVLPLVNLIFYYNPMWGYNNTITDADPGAGLFRLNNAALASVTEMYIADDNQSSVDLSAMVQSLGVGANLYLSNPNVKADSACYTVSGAIVNNTGYSTIPLTFKDSGTSAFTSGTIISFSFISMGTGNVVGPASAVDENIAVFDSTTGELIKDGLINKSAITANTAKVTYPAADSTKVGFISVTQAVDLDTMETDITANTAKVTNATHTGEVTGSGVLTVDPTAISNKTLVTAASGDTLLIGDASDSNNLKKVDALDFLGGASLPVADTTSIVEGSADATKEMRIEVDGLTTGTIRVATMPDADITLGTDADAIHDNVASEISGITQKVTPVNGDFILIEDSADSNNKKYVLASNFLAGSGDVSASAVLADNSLIRGDGGSKGVQDSGILIDDSDNITGVTSIEIASVDLQTYVATGTDNNQTGTTYTLVLADQENKTVWMSNASANVLTIPTNASVAFAVGTKINVIMEAAGVTTVTGDTGVTVNGTSAGSAVINNQYQGATLTKRATDTWIVSGDIT